MHEQLADDELNVKVILLAVGGAVLAAVLVALARRDESTPRAKAESVVEDVKKDAKKAAKAAKKKRKEAAAAAEDAAGRAAHAVKETASALGADAQAAERDLKAAAWDAHQQAQEAESRLRAAVHRVGDDASHLASRVGAEARHLADEGRERISHLRQREESESKAASEVDRLRAEIEHLKSQLEDRGRKGEKDIFGLASRFAKKGGSAKDEMTSQAMAAALAELEKSLKAKAPALLTARNRAQVLEILQQDLGPTLKESAVQAAMAALGMWESGRERAKDAAGDVRETARDAAKDARERARTFTDEIRADVDHAADELTKQSEAARSNGKRGFWRTAEDAEDEAKTTSESAEKSADPADDATSQEEHRGKAGLFWGGAGLGLALYALLDAERREKVLRLASEASVQVQELVRDLQGYDDEF